MPQEPRERPTPFNAFHVHEPEDETPHTLSKPAGDTTLEGAVNKPKGRGTIQRCLNRLETQDGRNIMEFKGKCKVVLLGQSNPVPQDSLGPLPIRQLRQNSPGGQEGGSVATACPCVSCVCGQQGKGTDLSLPQHLWDPTRVPCPVQAAWDARRGGRGRCQRRPRRWPGAALCREPGGGGGGGGLCSRGSREGRGIPPWGVWEERDQTLLRRTQREGTGTGSRAKAPRRVAGTPVPQGAADRPPGAGTCPRSPRRPARAPSSPPRRR